MNSLSLIQAIVLLCGNERQKKSIHSEEKIDRLEATSQNLALARELASSVLGRNLKPMPLQTKILFLLIEKMAENQCSESRFTLEQVHLVTGWNVAALKLHLNRLVTLQYLLAHRDANRALQYELLQSSKAVTTVAVVQPKNRAVLRSANRQFN